jgi:tRNA threonylcarbamoyladenosine biosynthesis protein TsaE
MGLPAPNQPLSDDTSLTVELPDEAATAALAARLAPHLRTGDVVCLSGGLGAGKTAFARALVNALPGPREEVPSPTFTLVQVYDRHDPHGGELQVWHFDLYRLERAEEVWELGLEDALAEGVSLIEWPERLGGAAPRARLEIALTVPPAAADPGGTRRRAALTGHGAWAGRLAAIAGELRA